MSIHMENFETIYGISNNIQVLRDKVLELAIQGKLVEQVKNDKSASELAKKIRNERDKLFKEGKIKREKNLAPVEDIPFEIPENWKWVRFDDIAIFKKGPFGSSITKSMFVPKGKNTYKVYEQKNAIQKEDTIGEYYIPVEKFNELKSFEVYPGDIIVSCAGTIGETYIMPPESERGIINQALMRIELTSLIEKDFFLMFFNTILNRYITAKSKGSAMKNIPPLDVLKDIPFAVPSQKEQIQIIEKYKLYMSEIDKLEELLRKKEHLMLLLPKAVVDTIGDCKNEEELKGQMYLVLENFETVFQTTESMQDLRNVILQLAIEGKLVAQDPNDESADELLKKIQREKNKLVKEGKIKKQNPLVPIEENEIPFEIPESWEWIRLGNITDINPRNSLNDNLDVSFVPMKLMDDGYRSSHGSEIRMWKDLKSGYTHFAENDIAVAKITPCFENRKSAILKNLQSGFGAGTTEFHIVRTLGEQITRKYLLFIFKTQWFISEGINTFTGTAGQQRVSTEFIKEFLIPLPPVEEQCRIVAKVESIMSLIDQMEVSMRHKASLVEKMASV